MEKCQTESEQIAIRGGYHIWWCKTHKRPLAWCDKEREVETTLNNFKEKIIRYATPYCCHVSGTHDPTHFENNPDKICDFQKEKAYDRLCAFLKWKPKAMVNPNGCYWCQTEEERKVETPTKKQE